MVNVKGWRKISHDNTNKQKSWVATLFPDKNLDET